MSVIFGTQRRPGEYAANRYRELRRQHFRRLRVPLRLLRLFVAVAVLVGPFVPGIVKFYSGVLAGAALALIVMARDTMPERIECWARGAEGERRTAKVLRPLQREGWIVRHDLQGERGNVDHLLIGPTGVFLLDTRSWAGRISVSDGVPAKAYHDTGDECRYSRLPVRIKAAAAETSRALSAMTGQRTWVNAVVVFWGNFEQQVVTADKVTYVHGDALVAWLRSQPASLPASRRQALVAKFAGRGGGHHSDG